MGKGIREEHAVKSVWVHNKTMFALPKQTWKRCTLRRGLKQASEFALGTSKDRGQPRRAIVFRKSRMVEGGGTGGSKVMGRYVTGKEGRKVRGTKTVDAKVRTRTMDAGM